MSDNSNNDQQTNNMVSPEPSSVSAENKNLTTQCNMDKGCSCGSEGNKLMAPMSQSYIFAVGKVAHRFPNKSVEMELAQATGRKPTQTTGQTYEEVIFNAVSDPDNRYIARQLCYVLTIEGLETYLLVASDPLDIDRLTKALRPPAADTRDIDVVIGRRGPLSTPDMCNGLIIPIVFVDQIYSFDKKTLLKSIPRKEKENEDQFNKTSNAVFDHITQIADNAGSTDEHRALNYLSVRYDEIYHRTQLMQNDNYSFTAVEVRHSRLSGTRKVVDVIFTYENRTNTAVQKWFVRVDVTEEFPFLVSPMQQYFER
jgi:hypothetical protein